MVVAMAAAPFLLLNKFVLIELKVAGCKTLRVKCRGNERKGQKKKFWFEVCLLDGDQVDFCHLLSGAIFGLKC